MLRKFQDLALSASGIPHIAYSWISVPDSIGEIRHAYKEGNDWVIETVWQENRPWLLPISFTLDRFDRPVVVFSTLSLIRDTSYLFLLRFTGQGWKLDTVDKYFVLFCPYSLKVSENGRIHILYEGFFYIFYAFERNGIWEKEGVTGIQEGLDWADLLLVGEEPHIVFSSPMELPTYGYKANNLWHFELIDTLLGFYPSLARNREGRMLASYSDIRGICLARRNFVPIKERERLKKGEIGIYPNPASSFFTIRLPRSAGHLKIYDIAGNLIRVEELKGVKELKVSLKGIKEGVYIVKVGKEKRKLVIKR